MLNLATVERVVREGFPEEVALSRALKAGKRKLLRLLEECPRQKEPPVPQSKCGDELGLRN